MEDFAPIKWSLTHPRIAAWIALSAGMVALLVIEARDVGLTAGNWIALIVATILVAGLCIWIVSWEDIDEDASASDAATDSGATHDDADVETSAEGDTPGEPTADSATENADTEDGG